jgi:hypothetical protein
MDEPPASSPLDVQPAGATNGKHSRRNLWARLLLTLAVIVTPLAYIISQQSPGLAPSVVAGFTPPTPIPTATVTPLPLTTILRARPLRLPTLQPHDACPVTPAHEVNPGITEVAGDDPVYLVTGGYAIQFPFAESANSQGWAAQDRVWFLIRPGVVGDVLVRGQQLDGSNEVRFGAGDAPDAELVFKAPAQARLANDDTWSISFNTMRLREAGCYAIQVDSEAASSVIVFRAEQQS